jgi:hypothetical protein
MKIIKDLILIHSGRIVSNVELNPLDEAVHHLKHVNHLWKH